jgi:hypothetical protein
MFPNLYYHTIPQNDLISCYIFLTLLHMCKHRNAYTHIHIQINHKIIYIFVYIHKCICITSYLVKVRHACLWHFVLFCFVIMISTKPRCFKSCSWCLWKALTRRGAWVWFHNIRTCSAKVLGYQLIFSLKIKLNCIWKFQRNWNISFMLLERSWWAGFNGIYLVRFGFRMWEILIL